MVVENKTIVLIKMLLCLEANNEPSGDGILKLIVVVVVAMVVVAAVVVVCIVAAIDTTNIQYSTLTNQAKNAYFDGHSFLFTVFVN